MASSDPPKLKLYANLLNVASNNGTGATISSAPVVYKRAEDGHSGDSDKKDSASTFRFQPGSIKRPQQVQKKKQPSSKPASSVVASSDAALPSETNVAPSPAGPAPARTTYSLADWMDDGDDVNDFLDSKRPRKKKKKAARDLQAPRDVNWDEFYNIREWTNLEQWKTSVARIRKHNEWKDYLKSHARHNRPGSRYSSEESDARPPKPMSRSFAPPASISTTFAPPPSLNSAVNEDRLDGNSTFGTSDKIASDHVEVVAERLSDELPAQPQRTQAGATYNDATTVPALQQGAARIADMAPIPPPPMVSDRPAVSKPSQANAISRAPVRYSAPEAPADVPTPPPPPQDDDDEDTMDVDDLPESTGGDPPGVSKRPGQRGFAERYMAKLGYKKGQGLGVSGTGITTALKVQAQKQKRRSDAEGGGVINRAAMGKIIGGKRNLPKGEDLGKHGAMSQVIKLEHVLDGMDLDIELGPDGNLISEIGQECGDKYGTVERVYVARSVVSDSKPLFIKFTSELSALRAVNALDGRLFAGNTVAASFWNTDKFEMGIYEVPKQPPSTQQPIRGDGQGSADGWN